MVTLPLSAMLETPDKFLYTILTIQSVIQRHGFEQNLFSQLPWLIKLLIFIKTTLSSIADNVSTFSLKHFKCNINIVYTAQTESSNTKISLFWNEKFTIGYQFYELV